MSDFSTAVSSGDYLSGLEATRDAIVADLADCESMRDKAALYNRLESVMKLIRDVKPVQQEGDAIDEVAKRRAARRSGAAKGSARSKRSG